MKVLDGMHAGQSKGGWSHVRDAGTIPECEVIR